MTKIKLSKVAIATLASIATLNAADVDLDTISVTATKIKTGTKEVSGSLGIVDQKEIEDKNILNIQEAIENIPGVQAESGTNSPSPRLIIRGAGLKANYGVREIMVVKDGVPMTDPDSFTRFDYIDMQDVSSVEVQKGPGSINAANATGGVIQLITKSVFEEDSNKIKIGAGDDGQQNINLKYNHQLGEDDFSSITFSKRKIDNSWRDNNKFDSAQITAKHGHIFKDDSTLETQVGYTESNMKIPASMTNTEFEEFKNTGKQTNTSSAWQNNARNSKIFSLNSKYEKIIGDITYKPRVYFNTWEHFHPVTGMINDSDNNDVYGTDLEMNYAHKLFDKEASFVGGVTWKTDITKDSKKYTYGDVKTTTTTSGWGANKTTVEKINKTLSDARGDLANTESTTTTLYGVYLMESFSPTKKFNLDISTRADKLNFDIDGDEIYTYNYSSGTYTSGSGTYNVDKSFSLFSAKLGLTYSLSDYTNLYTSIATANQAPTTGELEDNKDLGKSKNKNYELGLKTRANKISYDLAIYQNDVTNEIVEQKDANNNTIHTNAGKTRKRGLEFNSIYRLNDNTNFGANYAYSNFKFVNYSEVIKGTTISYDGNYLTYIPKHQYSIFATYKMANGFKSRITTKTWGKYFMDDANTKTYEGYKFITDLMLGYDKKQHSIQLNIKNITDKYYAMQVKKSSYGTESYKAAAPRSAMLTYTYKF